MTVRALTEKTDSLFPNVLPFSQKAAFLYELDRKIYCEFISSYGIADTLKDADPMSPERELLVESPFTDLYHHYLCMQMELISGNITGYQNQAALFNSLYLSFMHHFNRGHLMLPRGIIY